MSLILLYKFTYTYCTNCSQSTSFMCWELRNHAQYKTECEKHNNQFQLVQFVTTNSSGWTTQSVENNETLVISHLHHHSFNIVESFRDVKLFVNHCLFNRQFVLYPCLDCEYIVWNRTAEVTFSIHQHSNVSVYVWHLVLHISWSFIGQHSY